MEIPKNVLDSWLDGMARSHLEIETPEEKQTKKTTTTKKPVRRFKSNPTILGTATVLFSKEGKYQARVLSLFSETDDGNYFRVDKTGRTFTSHRLAINNARKWLLKKRTKYYKKHPKEKPRIKTVRVIPKERKSPIKTINKLHKMKTDAAKILHRMSGRKLKIHNDYSRKKFDSKKTTAVSGSTEDFNRAIYVVMKDGTKKERKIISKMLKEFTHEPFRKTNMFY